MARYSMQDGSVVDTENAKVRWNERSVWTFSTYVSKATGSEWEHETLYRGPRGQYYVEHTSEWQGSSPEADWVTPEEASHWLLANDYADETDRIPEDLRQYVSEMQMQT